MCLLRGTKSGVDAVAASFVETMVMVTLLASSRSSRGLCPQQAGRIKRRPEQRNIRLNGLRELISWSVDRIDAEMAQSLDDRGITADHGQRLGQVLDDRTRRSRRCEIGVPTDHVKPGMVSATVGISGNCGERSAVDIARRRALPIRTGSMTSEILPKNIWTVPDNNAAIVGGML